MKSAPLLLASGLFAAASLSFASGTEPASASPAKPVGAVFYILLENRNFTSGGDTTGGSEILGNAAAPYINSLITPGNANAAQVSYCTAYHNVLAQPAGASHGRGATSVHPSEPNYLWFEGGTNFGVLNDNDPYGVNKQTKFIADYLAANPSVTGQHFTGLLQAANISWHSYQEDIDLTNTAGGNGNLGGKLTNKVLPESAWTVPLSSFSGHNPGYANPYSGKPRWSYGTKHDGSLFFTDTNGSTVTKANTSPSNPFATKYRPLESLHGDLNADKVARFNLITPELYNDMHNSFADGFTYHGTHYTGDLCQVALGDNFLSKVVPLIMASKAYKDNGVIVIWTDETEGSNENDFRHTMVEIVISPLAKGNAYASHLNYTHSTDLNTLQKIFRVSAETPTGFINDAANPSVSSGKLAGTAPGFGTGTAYDLSDLFVPGTIPTSIPAPARQSTVAIAPAAFVADATNRTVNQTVTITNNTRAAITVPVYLAVDSLSANTSLHDEKGRTKTYSPRHSPYVVVNPKGLAAGETTQVTLVFDAPASGDIVHSLRVIATSEAP